MPRAPPHAGGSAAATDAPVQRLAAEALLTPPAAFVAIETLNAAAMAPVGAARARGWPLLPDHHKGSLLRLGALTHPNHPPPAPTHSHATRECLCAVPFEAKRSRRRKRLRGPTFERLLLLGSRLARCKAAARAAAAAAASRGCLRSLRATQTAPRRPEELGRVAAIVR